ncbi:MAG TPA: pitrilysin family protein [Planctomycetota bacterium]|jgi:predicted Zn-dependent peptidase
MPDTVTADSTLDTTLSTGLRLVGERIDSSQGVAISLRIPAGLKDDPPNKFGLANLVKETLFKGTQRRNARALSDAFDFLGIRRHEYTATESTVLQLRFLTEHLEKALELLREVLCEPAFPEKECQTARVQAMQELKHLDDDPFSKVFVLLKELYFGANWGHYEYGTESSVPELSRSDMDAFWRAQYIPSGSVAAVAGNYDPAIVQKQLEKLLPAGGPAWPVEDAPSVPSQPLRQHVFKDSEQTQMALAFPAVPKNHPNYYVARAAASVLGEGMSSRLFTEVREKRALVYTVGSQAVSLRGAGAMYVYAGTTAPRAAETLKVIKDELARLGQDITQQEIDRAKVGVKAHMLMDQESTYSRARELVDDVFFEGRIVPLPEVVARIDKVTAEEVKAYWAGHPFEPYAMVTLGKQALE